MEDRMYAPSGRRFRIFVDCMSMGSRLDVIPSENPDLEIDTDGTPTIFLSSVPLVPGAYFTGPWLPMSYADELVKYFSETRNPLEVLESKKEIILKTLLELLPLDNQLSMLDNKQERLEVLLDDLLALKGERKHLYQRWSQRINGKVRDISIPQDSLEHLLIEYVKPIIMEAPCHSQCHGGEQGFSPKKSLSRHLPLGTVLSFDLANAFKNTHIQYVFDFYYTLFENKIENREIRRDIAGFLTSISTVYYSDTQISALPVGSPISICLFNRLFYPIDEVLHICALKKGLRYTRWVDDITISAKETNRNPEKICGAISMVRREFPIAVNKVFFQQNVPEFYLLGHKIIGNRITKMNKEKSKDKLVPLDPECIATEREIEWIHEVYMGEIPPNQGECSLEGLEEDLPF
ncbi:hypothetical protein HYT57_03445 [Candidatus Woesearchaeota archaeon]|nr:hypothetical protein [Candidatus Woesearchaeota archaeon]